MALSFFIGKLSNDFFDKNIKHKKEFLYKRNRPYLCLIYKFNNKFFICLPFRTNIKHNQAYHFKKSRRSKKYKSGLDYSKMVLVDNFKYIKKSFDVDQDEYSETIKNLKIIMKCSINYLETYKNHINNISKLNINKFNKKYRYSTLRYFHNLLLS